MNTICRTDGCSGVPVARGLCSRDYQRAKASGVLDEVAPKVHPPCVRCGGAIPQSRRFGAQFCSTACKDAEVDARKHKAIMDRQASRRISCAWCETSINLVRVDQRFCSRVCADNWRNDQVRLRTLRVKKTEARTCRGCGEMIPTARPRTSIYCSVECKRIAGNANPAARKKHVDYNRQYLYGITPERFAEMFANQSGQCAICRADEPGGKGWHLDHCHASGKNRGILCHHCNVGLGNFKDDPDRLRAAAAYLEDHLTRTISP